MAIIPQFRADGPAMAQAPALEQERGGVRLNASGELAELGGLAQRLAQGNRPLQGIDGGIGQGVARGISDIGQGMERVGEVIFGLRKQVAEAKIDADENDAQIAMERLAGEFEIWKETNPPHLWEADWNGRISAFGDGYFSGKDLAPAAKERIAQRLNSFAESRAVRVGVEAAQVQARMGKGAVLADIARAKEAGDREAVVALSRSLVDKQYAYEDEATMTEIQALSEIENREMSILSNNVKADVGEGKWDLAAERVVQSSALREDEKRAQLVGIDNQKRRSGYVDEAKQVGYKSPADAQKMLSEIDETGNYKNWPGMSNEDRYKLGQEFRGMVIEEQTDTLQGVLDRASREGLSEGELHFDDGFKALPVHLQMMAVERVRKGSLDDLMDFSNFSDKVRSLDARTADGKEEAELLKQEAIVRFSGERREAALQGIQTRIDNPKPLMPDDEAITMARTMVKDRFENEEFGRFKFPRAEIEKKEIIANGERTGEFGYFVKDPAPPEGFGYRERYERLWGTKIGKDPYRRIKLTPDQEREFESAKADKIFMDEAFRQSVGTRMIDSVEAVERKKEAGGYDSATDYGAELGTLMGISNKEAFDRRAAQTSSESGLPPAGVGTGGALFPPALRPIGDPKQFLNSLGNATGY